MISERPPVRNSPALPDRLVREDHVDDRGHEEERREELE